MVRAAGGHPLARRDASSPANPAMGASPLVDGFSPMRWRLQPLRGSGAFCDISELPDGSVWPRATPAIKGFTGERIEAVFRTLAPVLLTGRTEFTFGYLRLVQNADTADHQ